MSKFTPGRWSIAPPIFDGDAIFAPSQEKGRRNEVIAMGILNKADARLIVAAPEMYLALKLAMRSLREGNSYAKSLADAIETLLEKIDGKGDDNE